MISMRVLLVEDDAAVREMFERQIGKICSRFVGIPTLREAIQAVTSEDFDIVLLDLVLLDSPRQKTLEAIPALRRLGKAPVIVVSGAPDPELKKHALEAGADAVLSKDDVFNSRYKALLLAVHAAVLKSPKPHANDDYLNHVTLLEQLVHAA